MPSVSISRVLALCRTCQDAPQQEQPDNAQTSRHASPTLSARMYGCSTGCCEVRHGDDSSMVMRDGINHEVCSTTSIAHQPNESHHNQCASCLIISPPPSHSPPCFCASAVMSVLTHPQTIHHPPSHPPMNTPTNARPVSPPPCPHVAPHHPPTHLLVCALSCNEGC
jgi:hypothetical protein